MNILRKFTPCKKQYSTSCHDRNKRFTNKRSHNKHDIETIIKGVMT